MRIAPVTNNISFQKLPMHKEEGFNVFNQIYDIPLSKNKSEQYNVSTRHLNTELKIKISDPNNRESLYHWHPVAYSQVFTRSNYMYLNYMETTSSYQKKGLSTTLHLFNIIEMLENNLDAIKLDSLPSTITYHAKMKYQPQSGMNTELKKNLQSISKFDPKYKEKIDNLLNSKMSNEEKAQIGCKIMDTFIQKAINNYPQDVTKWIFDSNMQMVLTKEQVLKNKDFYNKLFEKYNIDYKINSSDV